MVTVSFWVVSRFFLANFSVIGPLSPADLFLYLGLAVVLAGRGWRQELASRRTEDVVPEVVRPK